MAIIKCPECGHQTSDKAKTCPSCGVEIAGKIVKCAHCGEVYFKSDGLCPRCYRPYTGLNDPEAPPESTPAKAESTPAETTPPSGESEPSTETLAPIGEEKAPASGAATADAPAADSQSANMPEEVATPSPSEAETADEEETPATADTPPSAASPVAAPESKEGDEGESDGNTYIDTDGDNLERPVHIEDNTDDNSPRKHSYIPIVVSLAITAIILAVCFYFYNDTKITQETDAFEMAMKSRDVSQLNSFLRNYSDATAVHRKAATEMIAQLNQERDDLSLIQMTREKSSIEKYLSDYPDTPHKKHLLAIIDSIDWEDAQKTNTKAAYEQYLAAHADGLFAKEAQAGKERTSIKISSGTPEDKVMAKSLFREFFLGVNGNDAPRMTAALSGQITNFMGTQGASSGDVVGWMRRQHGDDVSNVIWKLDHNYKISRREHNGQVNYSMQFKAQKTVVKKDGRTSTEHYKVTSDVTGSKKIASMNMMKYTPSDNTASSANTASASKPSSSSSKPSSSTSSKPSSSTSGKSSSSASSKSSSSSSKSSKSTSSKSSSSSNKSSSSTSGKSSSSGKSNQKP